MDILIVSEFCDDFSATDNDRFLYLAKQLCADNDVEIVTSSFRHTTKGRRVSPAAEWPFKITFIEEPGYPNNICFKRFLSHNKWGRNLNRYLKERITPDVVYCAIPSLTGPAYAAVFCRKNGVHFVIDVQDLWPEAFKMIVNIPIISDIVFAPFTLLANIAYKSADAICGVSTSYVNRAHSVNKKCSLTETVFLGTSLDLFDKYAVGKPIMRKPANEIWLAYCGTLGASYNITCVIDAMAIADIPNLKFIIMGDGPERESFEKHAGEKGVNTIFTGRLRYNEMCSLLKQCDITINPIVSGSAATIINKHGDYAASGLPVINTQQSKEYRELVDKYEMGVNCSNEPHEVANQLLLLVSDSVLRKRMGRNARKCAEECFDRKKTYIRILDLIQKVSNY